MSHHGARHMDVVRRAHGEKSWMIVVSVLVACAAIAVMFYVAVLAPLYGIASSNDNAEILRNLVWPH